MRLMDLENFREFCKNQGINFIKNFELYYDDLNEKALVELNLIYKSIIETKAIKYNINAFNLIDWFFKAGSNPYDFMKQPSSIKIRTYGDFIINLLYGEEIELSLRQAIEKNIIYIDY